MFGMTRKKRQLLEEFGYCKTLSGKWYDGHGHFVSPMISYKKLALMLGV